MRGSVALDISELVANPVTTGIQRVTHEIFQRWLGPRPLVPVRLDFQSGEILKLSARSIRRVERLFSRDRRSGALLALKADGEPVSPGEFAALLNPEVFHDVRRAQIYKELGRQVPILAVAYDFLPQLTPEYFDYGAVTNTMWYLHWLRSLDHIAFISERSRSDFMNRIVRRRSGEWKAFALGADGLGTAEPSFQPGRRRFVCLGTIEPRKNLDAVLGAFNYLWQQGVDAELTFVGRTGWAVEEFVAEMKEAEKKRAFRWVQQHTDAQLRELIRGSRATIFASKVEGYGLPAVESLALGVPVIVTASLPSVETLPTAGQVRLSEPDPDSIADGVRELLDDHRAREKTMEISQLVLPTWQGFVASIASWVHEVVRGSA